MLPILNDVDIHEDIPPQISVLIPTLNDAEHIQRTVVKAKDGFNVECIVVDGGSVDGTLELAENAGATISQCVSGRNIQMKVGDKFAVDSILFFIYPDTELPDNWDTVIRSSKDYAEITLGPIRCMSRKEISGSNWFEVR
jgi:glycosyltransferase involved in cell wall biosynthesis